MDLAALKFKVETGELELAIKMLDTLSDKAKNLSKTTTELMKADQKAANVSIAQAKAQLALLNVQLKQAKVEDQLLQSKAKKARLDAQEAKNALTTAKAAQAEADTKLKTVRVEEKLSKTKTETVKAVREEISASDALAAKIQMLAEKTAFVVQGNSRAESSFLAVIKSMGATADQMQQVTQLFEVQRKVIGGDPFDKSASAAAKMSRELQILQGYMKGSTNDMGLTRNQAKELARELERLTLLAKQQNMSSADTSVMLARESAEYVKNAKALNVLESELRAKTEAADAARRADERRAEALRKIAAIETKAQNKLNITSSAGTFDILPKSVITNLVNYQKALADAGVTGEEFTRKMQKMQAVLVQTESIRSVSAGLSSFAKSMVAGAVAMVGLNAAFDVFQKFFQTTDMLKNMEARMNAVSEGAVRFADTFPKLVDISNQTGASLESVGTIFNRLLPAMESYGRGGKDAMKITENLSKILRVSGASASEASASLLQISQAFAKGKLDGDEFRSVAENMPEVLRLLEQHLNKTRGQLYLMAEQGQITGNILSEVLSKNIEKLDKQIEGMPITIGIATNNLRNSFTSVIKTFDDATGASDKVAKGIQAVANGMETLAGVDMSGVSTFFSMLAGAGVAGGIYAAVSAMGGLSGAVGAVGVAITALGATLLANPPLLALLGLGAAVGAVLSHGNKGGMEKPADNLQALAKQITAAEKEIKAIEAARTDRSLRNSPEAQEGYKKQLQEQKAALQEYIKARDKLTDESQKTAKAKSIAALPSEQGAAYQLLGDLQKVYAQSTAAKNEQLKQQLVNTKNAYAAERNLAEADFKRNTATLQKGSAEYNNFLQAKNARIENANKQEKYITEQTQKDIEELLKKGIKKKQEISMQFSTLDTTADARKVYDQEKSNQERQTKFLIAELEFRHKYGLISAEEYYARYEDVANAGMANALKLEADFTRDAIAAKEKLIKDAGAALATYKAQNKGVEGYTEKVADATERYNLRVADLRSEIRALTDTSNAFKQGKLDEYFKRMTERTDQFAAKVFNLKQAMEDSIADENRRVAAQLEEYEMQKKIIGLSEDQAAGVKAEYEERKRLNEKFEAHISNYKKLQAEQATLMAQLETNPGLEITDNASFEASKARLAELGKQLEAMKATADDIKNRLTAGPEQAKLEAIRAAQEKSYAEFVDKLGDGIYIGLTKGAKAGAKSIRETIVEELSKPIQVFVKAVLSDFIKGGGSNLTNLLDIGSSLMTGDLSKITSSITNAVPILGKIASSFGSVFGGAAGTTGAATGSAGMSAGSSALASVATPAVVAAAAYLISKKLSGGYKLSGLGDASYLLGPLVNRAFGMQAKKISATGITGTFSSSGFSGQNFTDWTQKGGWFRSNRAGTSYSDLDSSTSDSFSLQYNNISAAALTAAKAMGVATDGLQGFSKVIRLVLGTDSTKNQEAVTAMFNDLSDSMVNYLIPAIGVYSKENETSTATLTRLSSALIGVNQVFSSMNKNLVSLSVESANAASSLVDLFGSIEKLQEATATYVDSFYTDSQKFALSLRQVNEVFSGLGISVPSTKEAFKGIVDQLDITTEFGNKAYYALISIAPAFASLFESAETTKTKFKEVAKSIRDTITGIKVSQLTPVNEFAAMKQTFDSLVAKASVATGDELVSLSNQINSAIEPLLNKAKDVYATGADFVAVQEEIFAKAGLIADVGDKAGTVQDQSLVELQTISDILAKINSTGLLTVDKLQALLSLNTNWSGTPVSVGTSSDSTKVNAILAAINEASKLSSGYSAKINSENLTQSIAGVMQQIQSLTNEGNSLSMQGKYAERYRKTVEIPQAIAELQNQLANLQAQQAQYASMIYGNFSTTSFETQLQALRDIITANGGIPQFAKGGMFTNGVVSEPTLFNMGMMGEAGSEAIMPLMRTADGSLGVRTQGSGDMQAVVDKLSENNLHAEANVKVSQAVGKEVLTKLAAIERRLEGLENESRLERYKA